MRHREMNPAQQPLSVPVTFGFFAVIALVILSAVYLVDDFRSINYARELFLWVPAAALMLSLAVMAPLKKQEASWPAWIGLSVFAFLLTLMGLMCLSFVLSVTTPGTVVEYRAPLSGVLGAKAARSGGCTYNAQWWAPDGRTAMSHCVDRALFERYRLGQPVMAKVTASEHFNGLLVKLISFEVETEK
jgi:hypothetical protein